MISFWALIEESDIEAFAGTLILPSYMSHLRLVPFRWDRQPANPDGRRSLVLTYVGQGRVEELPIHPEKHALELLHYTIPRLPKGAVDVPEHDAIWIQSRDIASCDSHCDNQDAAVLLKVFFEPAESAPQDNVPDTPFSPFQTYVSISRWELFIGEQVIGQYLRQWLCRWLGEVASFQMTPTVNGIGFCSSKLGGELLVENDEIFRDILRFSGLRQPLEEISGMFQIDFESPETQVGEAGILLKLTKKQVKHKRFSGNTK